MFRAVLAITVFALLVTGLSAQDTVWRDARELTVEGQGFDDTAAAWDRLPARAEELVPAPVWRLSRDSAGIAVRFLTDAARIEARWTLTSDRIAMPHMPASGVSGLDLFVRRDDGLRWVGATRPGAKENRATLANFGAPAPEPREFLCYLPLYNGVVSLEIGVPEGARLLPAPPRPADRLPIVFYGTSITQGGCASRPGACHVAILGRRLGRETINLGFSGNGRMDLPLADLLAEIDAAVYVIDCLPNMSPEQVEERAVRFVERLREKRPHTPILLVEDRTYADAAVLPARRAANETRRRAMRAAYEQLRGSGVEDLAYLPGDGLLAPDGEDTVDGSHPTDLGFVHQADAFEPVLRELLR